MKVQRQNLRLEDFRKKHDLQHLAIIFILISFIWIGGCSSSGGDASSCQKTNTATVRFQNTSTNTTQEIIWDGLSIATISPGNTSPDFIVSATQHTLVILKAGTSTIACPESTITPFQFNTYTATCSN
jgi:hypothetical protein